MSTSSKKRAILRNVTVKLGCSSSCKLSSFFHPKPRRHSAITSSPSPSPASYASDTEKTVQGFGRIGGESVAVEKDSDDPYVDFRQSMLQMILEKEIYCKDELRELLNCFLQLNSPYYHGIIVTAFTEIWHSVFSVNPAVAGADSPFLRKDSGGDGGGGGWWSRV